MALTWVDLKDTLNNSAASGVMTFPWWCQCVSRCSNPLQLLARNHRNLDSVFQSPVEHAAQLFLSLLYGADIAEPEPCRCRRLFNKSSWRRLAESAPSMGGACELTWGCFKKKHDQFLGLANETWGIHCCHVHQLTLVGTPNKPTIQSIGFCI